MYFIFYLFLTPLTILINLIFTTGTFPNVFKHSKVIPLYKKGDSSQLDNFHPISIILIFAKIIEIILKIRLAKYFATNNYLMTLSLVLDKIAPQ